MGEDRTVLNTTRQALGVFVLAQLKTSTTTKNINSNDSNNNNNNSRLILMRLQPTYFEDVFLMILLFTLYLVLVNKLHLRLLESPRG